MTSGGIERRRAPRAKTELPIQLQRPSPTDGRVHMQPATLKDLSTHGLCCTLGQPLEEMTLVRLDLPLPKDGQTVPVQGVVVRCDKVRGVPSPTYEIGIFFHELDEESRGSIQRFVDERLTTA